MTISGKSHIGSYDLVGSLLGKMVVNRKTGKPPFYQWPFQDPRLEVPTIYKAYVRPKFQGISPQNMALYGTVSPL